MRHFSSTWFTTFTWIEYSVSQDATFCFPCRFYSNNYDDTNLFVNVGYKNWKNAVYRSSGLEKHSNLIEHKKCAVKWMSASKVDNNETSSVISQIKESHLRLVNENKNYIKTIAKVILFTAFQGIAQRGHLEAEGSVNRGNFLELVNLSADFNEPFRAKLRSLSNNARYLSAKIQIEITSIMTSMILGQMSDEIKKCDYFALIVDESKDMYFKN